MNKRMREIKNQIIELNDKANEYLDSKKIDKAEETIKEIEDLEREYVIAEKLEKNNKANITEEEIQNTLQNKKEDGFKAIAKFMKGQKLTEAENALIVESDSSSENGTNYLIPEDVQVAIRELRRSYKSAKSLVNVIPVTTLSGSTNFETEDDGLLDDFEDGNTLNESNNPKFDKKSWKIKYKGKLIYISNILLGNEKAQLLAYLNKWFVRKAVRTENKDIFDTLKANKTAIACKGLLSLKSEMNLKLDPSCLIGASLVTNQTGFDIMDSEVDENGRPMLQPDPTNATRKVYNGYPIEVFADAELKNVAEGESPVFIGNLVNGCDFMDRENLEFATSEHFAFNKNQTTMRVMEGYDVVGTDKDSYLFIALTKKEEKSTVSTEDKTASTVPNA